MQECKLVGLIPARYGSKRAPKKNIRLLCGHPMIAYAIDAARKAAIFDRIIVSTDSTEIADIAVKYGAEVPFLRPGELANDLSADFEWIDYTLRRLIEGGSAYDCFSILRPTNPFRTSSTIARAWKLFLEKGRSIDSLRAINSCKEHPGKMWLLSEETGLVKPLLNIPLAAGETPYHSRPYQALPAVYAQNASLEIAWSKVIFDQKNISGTQIIGFQTQGLEGFDINTELDWMLANILISEKQVALPSISPIFW